MDAQKIETELTAFLRNEVFAPDVVVTAETDLVSVGFDSMSLVRVLVWVETNYGMWIPESEITGEAIRNLRSLSVTVARLLQQGQGAR